ncbi:Uncharacterised protein [Salmonella enterica subsp. houtenae]|nr:Uncharacterised protein [Salmonella enterica subsp. houtenae]
MIFNAEMVNAILSGRKTQTRRPVKFPLIDKNMGCELAGNELAGELAAHNYWNSPYGKPGDRIWVRETFSAVPDYDEPAGCSALLYAADGNGPYRKWTPSIHMPRWASRITLEITDVRVERLHSISERDALREGLFQLPASGRYCLQPGTQYFGMASHSAKEVYSWLWASIYGEESWEANPWVWVIEFKRVEGAAL